MAERELSTLSIEELLLLQQETLRLKMETEATLRELEKIIHARLFTANEAAYRSNS